MAVKVKCPECGASLTAPAEAVGKTCRFNHRQARFVVPAGENVASGGISTCSKYHMLNHRSPLLLALLAVIPVATGCRSRPSTVTNEEVVEVRDLFRNVDENEGKLSFQGVEKDRLVFEVGVTITWSTKMQLGLYKRTIIKDKDGQPLELLYESPGFLVKYIRESGKWKETERNRQRSSVEEDRSMDSWLYLIGMGSILLVLLLVAPPVLAARKGYAWYLWTLAGGLGLIVLAFVPHANTVDLTVERKKHLKKTGNSIGAILSIVSIIAFIGIVASLLVFLPLQHNGSLRKWLKSLLIVCPIVIVQIFGLILAFVRMNQAPRKSLILAAACSLVLLVTIGRLILFSDMGFEYIQRWLGHRNLDAIDTFFSW